MRRHNVLVFGVERRQAVDYERAQVVPCSKHSERAVRVFPRDIVGFGGRGARQFDSSVLDGQVARKQQFIVILRDWASERGILHGIVRLGLIHMDDCA